MDDLYTVWIVVERHSPALAGTRREYQDLDSPWAGEASFDTEAEAQAYAKAIHDLATEVEIMDIVERV